MSGVAGGGLATTLLRGFSIEAAAHDRGAVAACRQALRAGTEVYVAFVPGTPHQALIDTATGLRAAGFEPVPHVVARSFAGAAELDALLAQLSTRAGVTRVLAIGGDIDRPAGPYRSTLQLIEAGLLQERGIREIGLACYPEPHPKIAAASLDDALHAKLEAARSAGLRPWLVSQFCFEARAITACAARLRDASITTPLRVGLAGPATRRALLRYALICGIGRSVRALGLAADLLGRHSPDAIVAELAAAADRDPGLRIDGVHLFTFGGIADAARWATREPEGSDLDPMLGRGRS